jgi:hypothetical protein
MPDKQISRQLRSVSPTNQVHPATGTVGASVTLTAREAGVTPTPFVPTVFRTPCEHCGHEMVFPWDPVLNAKLDALPIAEELIQDLTQAAQEDAP